MKGALRRQRMCLSSLERVREQLSKAPFMKTKMLNRFSIKTFTRTYPMPKVTFLPHEKFCPQGKIVEGNPGDSLIKLALDNGINIEHACEMSCACSTCHVIVTQGFGSLEEASDSEEDMLDKAWGLEANSRLSCQVKLDKQDLTVRIPKYTVNQVAEGE